MLFGVFLHGRLVSSDLIYLFNFCLSQYGLMDYFYALGDNPVLLISLLNLCPALAIESRVTWT